MRWGWGSLVGENRCKGSRSGRRRGRHIVETRSVGKVPPPLGRDGTFFVGKGDNVLGPFTTP